MRKFFCLLLFIPIFISCGNSDDSWKEEMAQLKQELNSQKQLIQALQSHAAVAGIQRDTVSYTIVFDNGQSVRVENSNVPIVTIGANGNWYVNNQDSRITAKGKDGFAGQAPAMVIGSNGSWFINGIDSHIQASTVNDKSAVKIMSVVELDQRLVFYFSDGTSLSCSMSRNNYLYGKILSVTGDSEANGNDLGIANSYGNLIAERNSMVIHNYAIGGRWVSTGKHKYPYLADYEPHPLVREYKEIDPKSDYILVHVGFNDVYDASVSDESTDSATYKGAFNLLLSGLQTAYPKAKIGIILPYYFNNDAAHVQRAEWLAKRCKKFHLQYLDGCAVSGLDFNNPSQKEYFEDFVHLTKLGQERMSYIYENFLRGL